MIDLAITEEPFQSCLNIKKKEKIKKKVRRHWADVYVVKRQKSINREKRIKKKLVTLFRLVLKLWLQRERQLKRRMDYKKLVLQ